MPPKPNQSTPISIIDFPYNWEDISSKLRLASPKELPNFILAPSFLTPWTDYRDLLPLKPNVVVPIIVSTNKDAMTDLVTSIYNAMDSMSTSKYDRPTQSGRATWTAKEYIECLIYQSARDLARPKQTFHAAFERKNLRNEPGRREAFNRLRGLVMLVCNLVVNYTLMAPSNVIRRIEATQPAKSPEFSPLPDVRAKWQLEHMPVEDLRRKVLDSERRGKEEKEWLIGILLGKEMGPRVGVDREKERGGDGGGAVVKREGSGRVVRAGVKRKVQVVEDKDGGSKRAKMVG